MAGADEARQLAGLLRRSGEQLAATVEGLDEDQLTEPSYDDFAEGRIVKITDFWPEPYEPPPGREHLVERW
jgi:hypothetical protein